MRPLNTVTRLLSTCLLVAAVGTIADAADRPLPPVPTQDWCATSKSNNERVHALHDWVASHRQLAAHGAHPTTVSTDGQVVLVEATADMIPFDHPADLEGRTLVFEPLDGEGFDVESRPLDYDDDIGARLHTFVDDGSANWYSERVDLTSLTIPFGSERRSSFYVTAFNSIHFDLPHFEPTRQYNDLEVASFAEPLIAPLFRAQNLKVQFPYPTVYVNETTDAVVVTWRSTSTYFEYDVQTKIDFGGTIELSYRTLKNVSWGSAIVTSGNEAWRNDRTRLWSTGTPKLDTGPKSVAAMKSFDWASIDRIGGTDVLELTLDVGSPIDPSMLRSDDFLEYALVFGDGSGFTEDFVAFYATSDQNWYSVPGWGWSENSPAITIDGDRIRMRFHQESVNLKGSQSFSIYTLDCTFGDGICMIPDSIDSTGDFGTGGSMLTTDLSALTSRTAITTPFETFTLPTLSPDDVWEAVSTALGVSDSEIDGVAIYQNFFTNLILYASAYSTVGNCGVNGISADISKRRPRSPALLHMNRIDFGLNADIVESLHVLSHELGHRWLYFVDIDEPGAPPDILRPGGSHPAQYVHMPAAFPLYSNHDSSTMGGAFFTDNGDGTFTAPDPVAYYGYTWNELYLMGLARPEEVEDWYWVGNSNPPLGDAYFPPAGITVSGERRDVTIDDVIRAMGPRDPAYAASQRRFRMPFVLLYRPGEPPTAEQIAMVEERRVAFNSLFPRITGERASVDTRATPPPRRRGVKR